MTTSYTVQNVIDQIRMIPDLAPIFQSTVAGFSLEPGLAIVNETMGHFFAVNFPWKFNEIILPPFYVNSYQQDYAGITSTGASITNLAWLQSGDCLDINNTALPKTQPQVETVRRLPRSSSWVALPPMFYGVMKFQVCSLPNNQLYYGTWGASNTGNATRGNNPQANTLITNPVASGQAMPVNCISQIQDANGNLLVITTYGTTGNSAPLLPANSTPGTTVSDGSVVWTVVDPLGSGFRLWPVPSQTGTVWQFNLIGQAKPPVPFTTLSSLISPIPDEYYMVFRQGCIKAAYQYSPEAKVRQRYLEEIREWKDGLMEGRLEGDRETESYSFVPNGGIVASTSGTMPITPGNPFGTGGW